MYGFNELVGTGFVGARWLQNVFKRLPGHHIRSQVRSPEMQAALTPDFYPSCQRLLISNPWFPSLQRFNVQLATQAAAGIQAQVVVGAGAVLYPCDIIMWGTGLHATEFVTPMKIHGEIANGAPSELSAQWRTELAATRLGIQVSGFTDLFLVVGLHTGSGYISILFMIECEVNYIVQSMASLKQRG